MVEQTWFFDDGDLTELDSSDEEEEEETRTQPPPPPPPPRAPSPPPATGRQKSTRPSTQNATAKSKARRGPQNVVPCLRPPRTTNYSASSLFEYMKDNCIDLNPEYQRGVVWNETKQTALIDSLFSNWYIPPIVFTVVTKDDGKEIRVCIDGKQRLTSIKRFMDGEIAYKDLSSNRKTYFVSQPGAKRKLISDVMRSNFKNKQITCVEYEGLTEEQEREIFQRVQLGVALSPADRLPAMHGPCAKLVRNLRKRIETTKGFELYLDWGQTRGKDFQALAQIVYLISCAQTPNKAEPTINRLEAFLSGHTLDEKSLEKLSQNSINVIDIFCRIRSDKVLGRPISEDLSPMEFVMASYMIYLYRDRFSDKELSISMGHMRRAFAKACPDKKSNTKNFKFIFGFVTKEVQKLPNKFFEPRSPGEKSASETPINRIEVPPRDESSDTEQTPSRESKPSTSVMATKKRKRPRWDDSENEYVQKKPKTAPSQAGPSTKKETAPTSKLNIRTAGPSRARTTVKRATSSASVIDRKGSVNAQVGTPSVRPPSSSRNGSFVAIASSGQVSVSAPPPTASSSTAVKRPTPTPYAFSAHGERPPLPGRTRLTVTPVSTPAPDNLAPLPTSVSSSSATHRPATAPGQTHPISQPHAQAQIAQTRPASPEVRNSIPVVPCSSVTDAFHATCTSAPATSAANNSTGGLQCTNSVSVQAKVAKKVLPSANVAGAAPRTEVMGDGRGQGQMQRREGSVGSGSNARAGDAGVGLGDRKRFPNFKKVVQPSVIQVAAGQKDGACGRQMSTSKGNNGKNTTQPLASIPVNAGGAAQGDRARAASMCNIYSGAYAPTAAPNNLASTTWRPQPLDGSMTAPTKDPRIAAREAAVANATLQERQRQFEQVEQEQQRAVAIRDLRQQQQQQYRQQVPTPPPSASPTENRPIIGAQGRALSRSGSDCNAALHPRKRPRHPSGL